MSANRDFAAEVLETSAAGYAGLAASLLYERRPEIGERFDDSGFSSWKAQLERWLLDLSAAVAVGEPALFEERMFWTQKVFVSRGANVDDLHASLEAMRDTLRERLPEDSIEHVVPAVERAMKVVAEADDDISALVPGDSPGRESLEYLEKILEGHPREAIEHVLSTVDRGMPVVDAYLKVLVPAQREAGRMWHAGQLSVGEEHVVTMTTQKMMALLSVRAQPASSVGKTVLLACVQGNIHDVGIRVIADFFEMAGWRAINLGADVPGKEIVNCTQVFDADLVVLAATLDPHIKQVRQAIEEIRTLQDREPKVIVGGSVFERVSELWRKVGADGHASVVQDAEPLGTQLTS